MSLSLIFIIFMVFSGCSGSGKSDDSARAWCTRKTDTLWNLLTDTRKSFTYGMDEIALRKMEMDSQLQVLRLTDPKKISAEQQSVIVQYASVLQVYKPIANEYREVVLESEDLFFQIKALEKSVREGVYDNKLEEFKKTWIGLNSELLHARDEAKEIEEKLKAVEPVYIRLAPKVDEILEQLTSS